MITEDEMLKPLNRFYNPFDEKWYTATHSEYSRVKKAELLLKQERNRQNQKTRYHYLKELNKKNQ